MARTERGSADDVAARSAVVDALDLLLDDDDDFAPKDEPIAQPQGSIVAYRKFSGIVLPEAPEMTDEQVEAAVDDIADAKRKQWVLDQATLSAKRVDDLAMSDAILPMASSRRVGLGLVFEQGVTFEQWQTDVRRLVMTERVVPWLLADALAYGEDVWGEDAAQALDGNGYSFKTLANLAWISRKIPNGRRRPAVPFYIHAEVAGLDAAEQDALLTWAEGYTVTREEMRRAVRKTKIALERARVEKLPAPSELPTDSTVLREGDARAMGIADGTIDAIITSPPYGLDGNEKGDKYRVEDAAAKWSALMWNFLTEAERVLKQGGRLIVNLPIDTTIGGYRPLAAQFTMMALGRGFTYATTILWRDSQLGNALARGSVDSPGGVRVTTPAEAILVFSKGDWIRKPDGRTTDLTHEEWVEWTNGDWSFPGETAPWEGFQAAYPVELPRRLIKLFTFREDVVLDPFVGSGTTALVAWRHGRAFYGLDKDPVQVASSRRRIWAAIKGQQA